jgi:hypothetical protein
MITRGLRLETIGTSKELDAHPAPKGAGWHAWHGPQAIRMMRAVVFPLLPAGKTEAAAGHLVSHDVSAAVVIPGYP